MELNEKTALLKLYHGKYGEIIDETINYKFYTDEYLERVVNFLFALYENNISLNVYQIINNYSTGINIYLADNGWIDTRFQISTTKNSSDYYIKLYGTFCSLQEFIEKFN